VDGALSDKCFHPSEYGRVSACVKRTKNDLALVKDVYGHPPFIVFEPPAEKFLMVAAIDPPPGYDAPDSQHSYIIAANGTPSLKRTINFPPPDTATATGAVNPTTQTRWDNPATQTQTQEARPEFIAIPNPDFIPAATMLKLKTWVHHWVLTRIPEQHQHLVNDVDKGDIEDLFVKVYD
jgi:hypothetical protein